MTNTNDPEEIIAVVNEDDNIIDKRSRTEVHQLGLLHREAVVLIINLNNKILIQERADNHLLDSSVAGHLNYDEDYIDVIPREVKEELNLNIDPLNLKEIAKIKVESGSTIPHIRFVKFFELKGNYPIEKMGVNSLVTAELKYLTQKKLEEIIKNNPKKMTTGFRMVLKKYFSS